jgi:iron-sulfur cluster assembly protein
MISLTEQASNKVKQTLTRRGKGIGIRIGVKTTGCSGLAYVLEYVDNPQEHDIRIDCDGCSLFVDPKSHAYLQGMTIDFVKKGLNEGFEFINPNAKDYCGCGESFRV